MDDDKVEILARETVYQGFFRVDRYRVRHRLFAGGWSVPLEREIFERGRTAGILLYDPVADAVVLVEQFRLPAHVAGFSAWQIEIVAGIIDASDGTPEDVARREAREEAGIAIIDALVPIHRYMPSPGGSSETVDMFCGRVNAAAADGLHGLADEHEDIKVVVLSYREAMRRVASDAIANGPTLLALHWLAANRARLRRLWR